MAGRLSWSVHPAGRIRRAAGGVELANLVRLDLHNAGLRKIEGLQQLRGLQVSRAPALTRTRAPGEAVGTGRNAAAGCVLGGWAAA